MLARKKELEGVSLLEEEHEAGCEVPEDVEEAPEADAQASDSSGRPEEPPEAPVAVSPVLGPTEFEPPAQPLGGERGEDL